MTRPTGKYVFDISMVLNAHHEGRAMQPTVRSLARSMEHALAHGLKVELVIVLDRPDELTRKYVEQNLSNLVGNKIPTTIREVDFGDLGLSRNYGTMLAKGTYVGTVDADDLFAENLITASVNTMRRYGKDVITHPEYVVSFGTHHEVWRPRDSGVPSFEKAGIVEYNPWPSLSFAPKRLREKYPYRATHIGEGFGPEDWQWNAETLGAGINHVMPPQTAYFYRRKAIGSLAAAHSTLRSLLYGTDILRSQTMEVVHVPAKQKVTPKSVAKKRPRTMAQVVSVAPRYVLAKTGRVIGPAFRRHRRTQAFEHYMRIAFRELLSTSAASSNPLVPVSPLTLPKWLINEWREQHNFEHSLFPDPELIEVLQEYRPVPTEFTVLYWRLLRKLQLDADYIFLVPWLKTGGADLVILNYVNAVLKSKPKAKVIVLATEITDSPWKSRLPKGVSFVCLDKEFYDLDNAHQTRLLGTLLLQVSPKYIHLVNSPLGFRTFTDYAKPLSAVSQLYVSAFNIDHTPQGKRAHSILDHMNYSIDYIQRVLTDNEHIIDDLALLKAMPREKFSVHYQPYPGTFALVKKNHMRFSSEQPLKVLWAGRLDRQKRPDILMQIAARTKHLELPIEFHVYGYQVLSKDDVIGKLTEYSNITYHGGFNRGLRALPLDNYDLYLTTAEYEGLPNILLEAIAGGLPVMAPAVGGIPELIQHQKTGYLISAFDNVPEYVKRLREFLAHPEMGYDYLAQAQELLARRHSWESFMEILIKDKYLDPQTRPKAQTAARSQTKLVPKVR